MYTNELNVAIAAARAAGDVIRDLYERTAAETYVKKDGSPVTDADLASDRIIREMLTASFPNDALLTEEGIDDELRLTAERVWIVDPIDGTQQFVERTGEFDVLIALVVNGEPVVGVLLQPTTGVLLAASEGSGAKVGTGGILEPFRFTPVEAGKPPKLQTSTWFNVPDVLPAIGRIAGTLGAPPTAISDCGVVPRHFLPPNRKRDVFLGLPLHPFQTMAWEWDFAAADIVVREAGGGFTDASGNRFRYNKPVPRNIGGIVMSVDLATHHSVIEAIAQELP